MKKVLLGLFALSAVSFAAKGDLYFEPRMGMDMGAKYEGYSYGGVDLLSEDTRGFGGEIALEFYESMTDNFDLGVGIAYQHHAERDSQNLKGVAFDTDRGFINGEADLEGADYKSIPLYVTAKYRFNVDGNVIPYVKANLGYSFNFDSGDLTAKYNGTASTNKGTFSRDGELTGSTRTDDGLYYAVGGGVEYNNFTVDLMYSVTMAETEADVYGGGTIKEDNNYERVVLAVGYKFNI